MSERGRQPFPRNRGYVGVPLFPPRHHHRLRSDSEASGSWAEDAPFSNGQVESRRLGGYRKGLGALWSFHLPFPPRKLGCHNESISARRFRAQSPSSERAVPSVSPM